MKQRVRRAKAQRPLPIRDWEYRIVIRPDDRTGRLRATPQPQSGADDLVLVEHTKRAILDLVPEGQLAATGQIEHVEALFSFPKGMGNTDVPGLLYRALRAPGEPVTDSKSGARLRVVLQIQSRGPAKRKKKLLDLRRDDVLGGQGGMQKSDTPRHEPLKSGFEQSARPPETIEQLSGRLIPAISAEDIAALASLIEQARENPPPDNKLFAEQANKLLDTFNLRIETQAGILCRLVVVPGANGNSKGFLQLRETGRGKRSFGIKAPWRIVRSLRQDSDRRVRPHRSPS